MYRLLVGAKEGNAKIDITVRVTIENFNLWLPLYLSRCEVCVETYTSNIFFFCLTKVSDLLLDRHLVMPLSTSMVSRAYPYITVILNVI